MNIVFFCIILVSFFASTISSLWILKRKENKWSALAVAFIVNSLILSIATMFLYKTDSQMFHKQMEGLFASLGVLVLVFFIPIITWINYFIIMGVKKKGVRL
ncbi:hypothetical protein OEV98_06165 [Caldibacillus lycopersici]|uniref:Uncharacterized protein n=1 Tax=Perspicuibacillus lycopersici TaxID=1325689 RepID=A0AAE3LM38_9BACI|nr:hypothetical protein [Perspicuibacillus lycopersici]MCU9613135.1 hypothetical protein [Perspicuibacillus lycopersici]